MLLLLHLLQQRMQNPHLFCTNTTLDHALGSPLGLTLSPVVNGSFSNEED